MNRELEQYAEGIAEALHGIYECLAPVHGVALSSPLAQPLSKQPAPERRLMIAVVRALIQDDYIVPGEAFVPAPHPAEKLGKPKTRTVEEENNIAASLDAQLAIVQVGDLCPRCGKTSIQQEKDICGSPYLSCPDTTCRWFKDIHEKEEK